MTLTQEKIELVLSQLGIDADSIAACLEGQGIRGHHGAGNCPIAIYLNRVFGFNDDDVFFVTSGHIGVIPDIEEVSETLEINLPVSTKSFVERFDSGDYPQLCSTGLHYHTMIWHSLTPTKEA